MMTYTTLPNDRRKFLSLTGLTVPEFQSWLPAFSQAYQRLYPEDQTVEGQPRRRNAGGGCQGLLHRPEDKLLFILVYLKTYPLQVIMGELFGLSQPQANHWIHRLLPVLQAALDDLGVRPERDPRHFARSQRASGPEPRLIIDGTERRRQRPKNPEKQALHYSGRKRTHSDKDVAIADVETKRIGFLSRTCVGKTPDKKIADGESISYPPGTVLYKDAGFRGYEPGVQETRQAKKKATARETHCCGETNES
jgi:Helix-turn-helix of DDE superfamily endonuclease/DDE superfamily endonuclease